MFQKCEVKRNAQIIVVLLCALTLKLYYSTTGVNQLRWILAPTTVLVELVTSSRFEFESHAGYISSDRTFVIAASCAGVNFLITAFLMLALRTLWRSGSQNRSVNAPHNLGWRFIPAAAVIAYLATLAANTVRISTALQMHGSTLDVGWVNGNQLHRFEGIFIYFGFLLLLFMVSEKIGLEYLTRRPPHADRPLGHPGTAAAPETARGDSGLFRHSFFPLLVYYTTTLGIPLANGAFRSGTTAADLWEHSVFVLLTPLLMILPLAVYQRLRFARTTS